MMCTSNLVAFYPLYIPSCILASTLELLLQAKQENSFLRLEFSAFLYLLIFISWSIANNNYEPKILKLANILTSYFMYLH
jgi:hypothetical protein